MISFKNRVFMVLLREAISGGADVLILGQKKLNPIIFLLLFCNLNSIYSGIDLKLWNIKKKEIFSLIFQSFKKNQVSQLLVHATASLRVESFKKIPFI
jgi:hypothetical protein